MNSNNKLITYKSLTEFVNSVISSYPRLNDIYTLNRSDALSWCVYILKELGCGTLREEPISLNIQNNMARIPDRVKILDGVYRAPNCNSCINDWYNGYNFLPLQYVKGIYSTVISGNCCNICNNRNPYTFSINYPFLIFNFTDQCVLLDTQVMEVDSDGIPVYPAEENIERCMEEYILFKWTAEPTILGEYNGNLRLGHEARYKQYFSQAKGDWLMPNQLDARQQINRTTTRARKFKITKYH